MKKTEPDRYRRGMNAEFWAAVYLRVRGYRILERRCRTPVGEIDIVARRGKNLVFVEVKSRMDMVTALESISPMQRGRIVRAAQYYMARLRREFDPRFDVIAIVPPFSLRHIRNAWDLSGAL